ncbi:MAG: hypothetical protein JNN27_00935 [Planctomycetes bacterium]|nr:hypothetical protein [Planctomycetota bacterium]
MAPLLVVWQVLCCCAFDPCRELPAPDLSASAALAYGNSDCHQPDEGGEHHDLAQDREACDDGSCHDDGSGECGCPKSQATLADAGAVVQIDVPMALAFVPMGLTTVPHLDSRHHEAWRRVEHPPPNRLLLIRVLRI